MRDKIELLKSCQILQNKGLKIYATKGTHDFLEKNQIDSHAAHWPDVPESPNALELIKSGEVDFVINIPKNLSKTELNNDYQIRRTAIDYNVPIVTNARLASAFIYALNSYTIDEISLKSWDEY